MVQRDTPRQETQSDKTSGARGECRANRGKRDPNAESHIEKVAKYKPTSKLTQLHFCLPTRQDLKRERPTAQVRWDVNGFIDGAEGADPVSRVRISLSVTKETIGLSEIAKSLSLDATARKSDGSATFTDLNFDTTYYARLFAISNANIDSTASEWSDPIRFPCPSGARCGTEGKMGAPAAEVVAKPGFFRVSWDRDNNLTFVRCNSSNGGESCLGETCSNGTTGPFCSGCLPGYSQSWSGIGLCDECLQASLQNWLLVGGAIFGVAVVGFLVSSTLEARGRASDQSVSLVVVVIFLFHICCR